MAFREWSSFAPKLRLDTEEGASITGTLQEVRSFPSAYKEGVMAHAVVLLCESSNDCMAMARSEEGNYEVDVVPGEEYSLVLGTILESRLRRVIAHPENYEGTRFRVTYKGLAKKAAKGKQPAKLYKVEIDDEPAPEEESQE